MDLGLSLDEDEKKEAAHPGFVYAFGGNHDCEPIGELSALDLNTWQWLPVLTRANPPSDRSGLSMTTMGDKIFFIGGCDGRYMLPSAGSDFCEVHTLSLAQHAWAQLEITGEFERKTLGRLHSVTALGHKLLLFGGNSSNNMTNACTVLDCRTLEAFSPYIRGQPPRARISHVAGFAPGSDRVLIYGGMSNGPRGDCHVLAFNSWAESKEELPSEMVYRISEDEEFDDDPRPDVQAVRVQDDLVPFLLRQYMMVLGGRRGEREWDGNFVRFVYDDETDGQDDGYPDRDDEDFEVEYDEEEEEDEENASR
eukprot:TRINITY_DN8732_c0_g3_i2.p1 TRINITY_DN8732_c0_g3~~TRINITY_DN8732_c0_g3_i2.p1  ORF type:complete len:317 (-),score=76.86 TRINITY_DN8732_c0_g3_i2:25-951(-)